MANSRHKFRAWDTEKNKMVKVDTIDFNNGNVNDVDFYNQEIHFGYSTVLMQYTGLKDKNGTEVYEGDILQEQTTPPLEVFIKDGHTNVRYTDMGETIEEWLFPSEIYFDELEVIGNIYEHPHLLKE